MISLFVEKGVAYIWNAEDWYKLRANHRICGSLIGSVTSYPRQNDFLGVPMALMSEEATLLVEKGICKLYELPKLIEPPTEELQNEMKAFELRVLEEQKEALKKRKVEQLSQKIDIILAGKKKKLLSQGVTDIQLDKHTLLQEEINKLPDLAPAHALVHLPMEHNLPVEKIEVDIEVLNPSVNEAEGALKYAVFKDLWEKGHNITSGSKFGSDYLVYPGDPVRFHAMYMVRCIYDQNVLFRPTELVTFGRLAVAVNKMAVLAYRDENGKIEYQTLQWHDSVINILS